MRADLNIHGLKICLRVDHPVVFQTLLKDLSAFRSSRSNGRDTLQLNIQTLPNALNGNRYPALFSRYRETALQTRHSGGLMTRYMTTDIAVITHPRKRRIDAAIVPEPSLLPDPAYHYLFTQPLNYWFKRRGLFFLHAGCVADGPSGVLFIGHSRSGKSTLSLSAVRSGFQFLSDEQPLLRLTGGRVHAHHFPRRIRLNQPNAARFPELRKIPPTADKRVVFPIETFRPGCVRSSCRLSLLVFPRFKRRGNLRLRRMDAAAALTQLLQDDHFVWYRNKPWDKISKRHLQLFEKLVEQAPAYTLDYTNRDIPKIPGRLKTLLRKQV